MNRFAKKKMPKKILITRDKESSVNTQNKLKENNFNSEILPLSEIEPLIISLPEAPDITAIIFTSRNALKTKEIEFWRDINKKVFFYIIGESLAEKLIKNSIYNFHSFDTVEDLIYHLSDKRIDSRYLYLRGEKVSYSLKRVLSSNIIEKICYRVRYKDVNAEEIKNFIYENEITDLLFFSYLNAQNFIEKIGDNPSWLYKYNIFCLSKKISTLFTDKRFEKVFHPKKPNLSSLLKIL